MPHFEKVTIRRRLVGDPRLDSHRVGSDGHVVVGIEDDHGGTGRQLKPGPCVIVGKFGVVLTVGSKLGIELRGMAEIRKPMVLRVGRSFQLLKVRGNGTIELLAVTLGA